MAILGLLTTSNKFPYYSVLCAPEKRDLDTRDRLFTGTFGWQSFNL
jgi:hypothetical protein